MKKWLSIVLAAIMLMTVGFALAEENPDAKPAPNPDRFSGTWMCDRAVIEIEWGSSAWECTEWEYSCHFQEDENKLVSLPFGSRTELVYNDDGEIDSYKTVYEDGEATFYLDEEGYLIWVDEKENAGEGMRFEFMPDAENAEG